VLGLGISGPHSVTTIRIQSGTKVPAIGTMWGPAVLHSQFLVNDDAYAGRGNGGAIEIKETKELCPSRQLWVEARATEEVQS